MAEAYDIGLEAIAGHDPKDSTSRVEGLHYAESLKTKTCAGCVGIQKNILEGLDQK
jgi:hypothetical protein